MKEFKQWHEMHEDRVEFFSETKVCFCQCGSNHKLNFFEVIKIPSDAAVEDLLQRGISWQGLYDINQALLVSRQSFRFHRMPVADENITIHTWEEKPEPFQFVRMYEFLNSETKELLISGTSHWLLVNPASRRILRTGEFTARVEPTYVTEHKALEPEKIAVPSEMKFLVERPVWFSDIDGNGHVNNARYGAFVIDALPCEYQSKEFTDLRINYCKEAKVSQMLKIFGVFDDEHRKITLVGKQNDEVCFAAEVYYK